MLCLLWNQTGVNTFFLQSGQIFCLQGNSSSMTSRVGVEQEFIHPTTITSISAVQDGDAKWEGLVIWGNALTGTLTWAEYLLEKSCIFRRFIHLGEFFFSYFFHSTGDKISNVIVPKKPSPFQNKSCCYCCLRAVSVHKLPITSLLSVTGWWILMNEMNLDFSQRFCSDSIPNPSSYCCLESNCVWREMLQQAITFFEHYYCAHGKQASHNL